VSGARCQWEKAVLLTSVQYTGRRQSGRGIAAFILHPSAFLLGAKTPGAAGTQPRAKPIPSAAMHREETPRPRSGIGGKAGEAEKKRPGWRREKKRHPGRVVKGPRPGGCSRIGPGRDFWATVHAPRHAAALCPLSAEKPTRKDGKPPMCAGGISGETALRRV
jgi:hypothetical protein